MLDDKVVPTLYAYNIRWNLERDIVDELTVAGPSPITMST